MDFWRDIEQGLEALCKTQVYGGVSRAKQLGLPAAVASERAELEAIHREWHLASLKLQRLERPDADVSRALEALDSSAIADFLSFLQHVELEARNAGAAQRTVLRRKDLQRQMSLAESRLLRERVRIDRERAQHAFASHAVDDSPLWAVVREILAEPSDRQVPPLRVFIAHPIGMDEQDSDLPPFISDIAQELHQFLSSYAQQGRAIDLYVGAWFSQTFRGEPATEAMFAVLHAEPTLVFEVDAFSMRVAFWGLHWPTYRYLPVVLLLDYFAALRSLAKYNAEVWRERLKVVVGAGRDPEELETGLAPEALEVMFRNLKLLDRQEIASSESMRQSLDRSYEFGAQEASQVRHAVKGIACTIAGLLADEYFLCELSPRQRLPPLLPRYLSQLLAPFPDKEAEAITRFAVKRYYYLYDELGQKESAWLPELSLDLAQSLLPLPSGTWARGQLVRSLRKWLELRKHVPPIGLEQLLDVVRQNLQVEDKAYAKKLGKTLEDMGISWDLNVVEACFQRGLVAYKKGEFVAAIAEFDRAIQGDSHYTSAYYQRGLAHLRLGQYAQAIEDFSLVLRLQPDRFEAYNYRGTAYREQGNYQQAIADYERCLAQAPDFAKAAKNLELTKNTIAASQRQQTLRENTRREFEYPIIKLSPNGQPTSHRTYRARYFRQVLVPPTPSAPDDDLAIELVRIPSGLLLMGSNPLELAHDESETPQHWVGISRFYLGKYPVTQAQWAFVASLPAVKRTLNPHPSQFAGGERPVENVCWYDAVEFCERLQRHTGLPYRLPSEAEWEYACRAGTDTPFHFGQTISTELANYDGSYPYGFGPNGTYRQATTPVGSFPSANAFGLYDMHGQVWEWCQDVWHDSYWDAPNDGRAWEEGGDPNYRVLRGGSWFEAAGRCRSALRHRYLADVWLNHLGFRLALTMPLDYEAQLNDPGDDRP